MFNIQYHVPNALHYISYIVYPARTMTPHNTSIHTCHSAPGPPPAALLSAAQHGSPPAEFLIRSPDQQRAAPANPRSKLLQASGSLVGSTPLGLMLGCRLQQSVRRWLYRQSQIHWLMNISRDCTFVRPNNICIMSRQMQFSAYLWSSRNHMTGRRG